MFLGIDLELLFKTYYDEILATIFIIIGAYLIMVFGNYLITKGLERFKNKIKINFVFIKILKWFLIIVTFLMILNIWGVTITPIVTSFGIVGVGISLGAQKVIQDLIAGIFIHAEDQFEEGDVIEIKGFRGTVLHQGPRITKIQNWKGEVMMISNGGIEYLINYSTTHATSIVDFPISYKEPYSKVRSIIEDYFKNYHSNDLLSPPTIEGVDSFNEISYTVKIFAKVKPGTQFRTERELKTGILKTLEDNNVVIAKSKLSI